MTSRLVEAANKNCVDLLYMALNGECGEITDEEMNDAMVRAAVNGNVNCVHALLVNGADPDSADGDGDTALMLATGNSKVSVIRLLLDYGCNVNLCSDHGRNALHLAAWNGNKYLVGLLMDVGCDSNVREKYGDVAIMLAAMNGHDEIVQYLIDRKCDVNILNYDNDTTLHYAARKGHINCAEMVLKAGAKLNAQNNWGYTPLMLAVCEAREDMTKMLLALPGCNVNKSCQGWRTALHYAVRRGLISIVEILIESGARMDVVDSTGNTPLIEAVYHNHVDVVKLLVKGNCNVSFVGQSVIKGIWCRCTPLDIALDRGNYEAAKIMLIAGNVPHFLHASVMHEIPDRLLDNRDMLNWFVERLCSPKPLSEICRFTIRTAIPHRVQRNIDSLPLPPRICDFLKLVDIDDIVVPE